MKFKSLNQLPENWKIARRVLTALLYSALIGVGIITVATTSPELMDQIICKTCENNKCSDGNTSKCEMTNGAKVWALLSSNDRVLFLLGNGGRDQNESQLIETFVKSFITLNKGKGIERIGPSTINHQ